MEQALDGISSVLEEALLLYRVLLSTACASTVARSVLDRELHATSRRAEDVQSSLRLQPLKVCISRSVQQPEDTVELCVLRSLLDLSSSLHMRPNRKPPTLSFSSLSVLLRLPPSLTPSVPAVEWPL